MVTISSLHLCSSMSKLVYKLFLKMVLKIGYFLRCFQDSIIGTHSKVSCYSSITTSIFSPLGVYLLNSANFCCYIKSLMGCVLWMFEMGFAGMFTCVLSCACNGCTHHNTRAFVRFETHVHSPLQVCIQGS